MTIRIDAHQHYWEPRRGDYDWMPDDDPVLARRYGPKDLRASLERHGIGGTVLVQAAASVEESDYLLGIADATDSVAAVVGWIDFEDRAHLRHLTRLSCHPKFVGVRPMIQDIPDVDWMLRDEIRWAFDALMDLDLTFDALGFPQHLENFLTLITRHPDLRVVIDHCMKPRIRDHGAGDDGFAHWAAGMSRLAGETRSFCKLSGLVTEAAEDWTLDGLRPFASHVIEAFGAGRVMWGSDWPVCRLRAEYDDWLAAAKSLCDDLGEDERDQIFGGTAERFYRL
jgi:L-fuconolactonase